MDIHVDSPGNRWATWKVIVLVALATAVHLAVNGYSFGGVPPRAGVDSPSSDHSNVLPWVHWYGDRTLFSRDYQIQMKAAYGTVLWPAIGIVSHVFPVEWTFFVLHLVSLAGAYGLIFLIARRWSGGDWSAALACGLFVLERQCPAGERTHDPGLYTRGAALPLALLMLLFALRGSAKTACIVALCTGLIHSLTAIYVCAIVAVIWVLDARPPLISRVLRLGGLAISQLIAAWIVGGNASIRLGHASATWLHLQYVNNAMHLFPTTWAMPFWFGIIVVAGLIALEIVRPGGDEQDRVARGLVLAAVGMIVAGVITADFVRSQLFMQIQPLRGLKLIIILAWVLAACRAGRWRSEGTAGAVQAAAILLLAAALAYSDGAVRRRADGGWGLDRNFEVPWRMPEGEWVDVQRWVEANTPKDSLFLVPPELEGFRTYSRRSIVGDWKQGTVSLFHEAFGEEWLDRMRRLSPRALHARVQVNLAMNYDLLDTVDLIDLIRRYGITHIVVRANRQLAGGGRVFDNGAFAVYQVGTR